MTETWCGVLLLALVPLVTGLNAALIAQVQGLRRQVGGRRSDDLDVERDERDG